MNCDIIVFIFKALVFVCFECPINYHIKRQGIKVKDMLHTISIGAIPP